MIPVGTRVRIVAFKEVGSAYLLRGLTAEVIGGHFIEGWVKIRLDPNDIHPERDWSISADRLVVLEEEAA